MALRLSQCAFFILFVAFGAHAAPLIPSSDEEVLERLPISPSDPVLRGLRDAGARLKESPQDLTLALRVARGYVELGRTTGDPRYVGYAQAALAPWWELKLPPVDVLLLRAALRQRVHNFGAALADLAEVARAEPRNAQARLIRATVLQVTGAFDSAREECRSIDGFSLELVRRACIASVDGATGRLHGAYDELRGAWEARASAPPEIRGWILTMLAEMAARADRRDAAEAHFRAALAIEPEDFYLLGAYADFLLDRNRPLEVESLLKGRENVDPLLLRLALAARAQRSDALAQRVAQLRDRFEASRLRGDTAHLREEARFTLSLLDDSKRALNLAQDNWRTQKEPADMRILVEAAFAAKDAAALDAAKSWVKATGLEDIQLERIFSASAHPN